MVLSRLYKCEKCVGPVWSWAGMRGRGVTLKHPGGLEVAFECSNMHVWIRYICMLHGEGWQWVEMTPVGLDLS